MGRHGLVPISAVVIGGVFDGLHAGHLTLIHHAANYAQAFGCPLLALINSDTSLASMRRVHQHTVEQRATLLRSVANFAEVIPFSQHEPSQALADLTEPGSYVVFFKGSDTVNGITSPPELGVPGVLYGYVPVVPGQHGQKLATRHLKAA